MLVVIFLMSIMLSYGQNTEKAIQKKDSTVQVVRTTSPEKIATVLVKKDSTITEQVKVLSKQKDSIVANKAEIKTVKENSIPTGNGSGIWVIIVVAVVLLGSFIVTKYRKNIGSFLTINEADLLKGAVMAFIMTILSSLIAILNAGTIPTDWPTWRMVIIAALATGMSYLLKNLLSGNKTPTDKQLPVAPEQPVKPVQETKV